MIKSHSAKVIPPYRDSSGRRLVDYPRPSVAVDTAVLTTQPSRSASSPDARLAVLLVAESDSPDRPKWGLPGTFVHEGERLVDAATRALRDHHVPVPAAPLAQLEVFDDPHRDDRGWVMSVAHLSVVPYADLEEQLRAYPTLLRLASADRPGPLAFDHSAIVIKASRALRARYVQYPDPYRLLPDTFTILELWQTHQAVLGRQLPKDTFRRSVLRHLRATGQMSTGTVGRPSQLFRRRRVAKESLRPPSPT